MKIKFSNLPVRDQNQALKFYTEVVGLIKAADIDMGQTRFLTVAGEDGFEGGQVVLGAADFPPTAAYQRALFEAGMPVLALNTGDVQADFERMKAAGVAFRGEPRDLGPIVSVLFEDTCGNLIHLVQAKG
ncbi:MAG TPA: VOC family protein [Caulobacteraceae bacterium]|jgi:predicted enzyme related to lactoylglutathione lyase|nr:VOC family protein [Caulobacteraceae bacterium]